MIRASAALALLAGAIFLGGCQSPAVPPAPYDPLIARFYLEARPGGGGITVRLPQSGVTVVISPRPVLVEYDVVHAEVAQVDLGRCLLVQVSPAAARDLYRMSVGSMGRRLVLALNDEIVGAHRIESAITDGVLLVFLETPDEELASVVERLRRTAADLAEASRKARKQ